MMQKLIKSVLVCILAVYFTSCTEDRVYEQNYDFADSVWPIAEDVQFKFDIEEAGQLFQIYVNLRHDVDYAYRNIYIKYQLSDSTDYVMKNTLANLQLFSDKEGRPFGQANSNIVSYQGLLIDSLSFPHEGSYTFSLDQYMRTDSLKGIYSVGIKILKQPTDAE